MSDLIRRQDAIEACRSVADNINSPTDQQIGAEYCLDLIKEIPSAEPEIIRCKDCKHWKQINYQGTLLPFGFCESEEMWCSLYGETTEVEHIDTDNNHYCGFAEKRML